MANLLRDLKILEVSSVDKAANKDSRVLFWKRDTEERPMDDMTLIQKMQNMNSEQLVALCKTDLVSKELVSAINYAMAQKLEGGTPEQKFARHVSQGVGKALLAIEIASPGRDCFAQAVFEKREPLVTFIKGPSANRTPIQAASRSCREIATAAATTTMTPMPTWIS
jgi:hypothetical protein